MYPFKREPGYKRSQDRLLHKYSLVLRKTDTLPDSAYRVVPKLILEPGEPVSTTKLLKMFKNAIESTKKLAKETFGERVNNDSFIISQEIEMGYNIIDTNEWVIMFSVMESEEDKTTRELNTRKVAEIRRQKNEADKETRRTKDIQKLLADPEAKEMLKELLKED